MANFIYNDNIELEVVLKDINGNISSMRGTRQEMYNTILKLTESGNANEYVVLLVFLDVAIIYSSLGHEPLTLDELLAYLW